MIPSRIFYVYVLFDAFAVPRYIGKGRGNRWLMHDPARDRCNEAKNAFIRETIDLLGDVPKTKIQEHISEGEAFALEALFIKTIGRQPNGPLTNLTDNRNGPQTQSQPQ